MIGYNFWRIKIHLVAVLIGLTAVCFLISTVDSGSVSMCYIGTDSAPSSCNTGRTWQQDYCFFASCKNGRDVVLGCTYLDTAGLEAVVAGMCWKSSLSDYKPNSIAKCSCDNCNYKYPPYNCQFTELPKPPEPPPPPKPPKPPKPPQPAKPPTTTTVRTTTTTVPTTTTTTLVVRIDNGHEGSNEYDYNDESNPNIAIEQQQQQAVFIVFLVILLALLLPLLLP